MCLKDMLEKGYAPDEIFNGPLLKNGFISCLSMNGSGIIHDYEFARIGSTTESVARYIKTGEFGMWEETGNLNNIINTSYNTDPNSGLGEAIGKAIVEQNLKYKDISLLANLAIRLFRLFIRLFRLFGYWPISVLGY